MLESAADRLSVAVSGANGSLELELGPLVDHEIRPLFALFSAVVAEGGGYAHLPPLTWPVFEGLWITPTSAVIAARAAGELVGAYYLKPNGPGRVAHVANAGYVVARHARRRGVARALVVDSLERARLVGFDSMQFNLVYASNPARALYEELGFSVVGRLPKVLDGEDALIYLRSLVEHPPASFEDEGADDPALPAARRPE